MRPSLYSLLAFFVLITLEGTAQAQILWQTPQAYTGTAADISTVGSFVSAVTENYAQTTETVGDTYFSSFSSTHISGPGPGGGGDGSGSNATPYLAALNGCAYNYTGNAVPSFTLYGLVSGATYQVQLWDVSPVAGRETLLSGVTTGELFGNDFILGTFTAGMSGSQSFSFQGITVGGVGEINAVEVRFVPEPSTYALMFAGLGFLAFCVRRKAALLK